VWVSTQYVLGVFCSDRCGAVNKAIVYSMGCSVMVGCVAAKGRWNK